MDNVELKDIYYQAGVRYYRKNFQILIKNIIFDLYQSNWQQLKHIQISHIDYAIFKYREVSKTKKIYHKKNYFKACLKSAIEELALNEF